MSKSKGRYLSELLGATGLVKRSRSALAGEDETIDLDALPTIPNSKLSNSSISIAGHTLSLGGSLTLNTADIGEHASYLYYTDARADGRIAVASIGDLSDVDITSTAPTSTQVLKWDAVNSKFIPGDAASSVANLTDVDLTGLANNSVLKYDSTAGEWIVGTNSTAQATANIIRPFAYAHITLNNYAANSGIAMSWGTYQYSSGNYGYYQFTFANPQPNANYAVMTDMVVAGDINISAEVSNRTTTGFRVNFYDANGNELNVGSVATYEPLIQVYSSTPTETIYADSYSSVGDLPDVTITSAADNNILQWNSSSSVWENVAGTTSNIAEGTNLYYTDARVGSYLTTNSYATQSYVSTAISNLVDAAPSTLDTLNELAAALGDDANFSTTVTNSIATKWTQDNTKISNWDTAYSWGNHASAGYITGNQTITLSGDVSGSGTTSIVVTVANDSHTHDTRYYTESEIDTRMDYTLYSPQSAVGGNLNSLSHYGWYQWSSPAPTNAPGTYGFAIHTADNSQEQQLVQTYGGATNQVSLYGRRKTSGSWDTSWTQYFSDHYHPNADKWTTARTLSLTGAVTGSASIDGSGNVSLATTATSDPTLTLSGDASGSATFTNLGNATLSVAVADDSHNHSSSSGSFTIGGQLIGGLGATTTSGTTNWNDSTNARAGMGYTLLLGTHSNGPGSSNYLHPVSFEYNSKNGSGNMTQFAIPYTGTDGPYFRSRYSGTWSGWLELWHSGNDGSGSGLDADTCDGQHLGTGANVTHAQIHASDWFRNTQSGEGIYNTPNNTHFYSAGPNYWHINTTSGQAYGALVLYDQYNATQGHSTGRKGYLYWDASGFGLLSSDGSWAYRHNNSYADIYGTIRQDGSNTVWHAGNDGSGSGLDADLLDGINSGSFLRSDSNDTLSANITLNGDLVGNGDGYRHRGLFGNYDSYRIHHMWSMGTAYRVHSNGSNFGNLYGFAYTYHNRVYTSNAMANYHQIVWCQNGTPNAALGTNIWTSGNVTAYSDIRVKTNLEVIPNALSKVQQLNGYTFDRTDVQYDTEGNPTIPIRQTGVVAQEVLKVLPEAVTGDEESHYNVAYGNMVGLLIEAIKELKSEVDDLKSQLEKK